MSMQAIPLIKGAATPVDVGVFAPMFDANNPDSNDPADIKGVPEYVKDAYRAGANLYISYGIPWFTNPSWPVSKLAVSAKQNAFHIARYLALANAFSEAGDKKHFIGHAIWQPDRDQAENERHIAAIIWHVLNDARFNQHVDHLLAIRIGNEKPGFISQINELAGKLKAGFAVTIDGVPQKVTVTQPIMTSLGAIPEQATLAQLTNVDLLGLNDFYGKFGASGGGGFLHQVASVQDRGWSKPWFVSEYYSYDIPGPVTQNLNGATYTLEENSTTNAKNYTDSWNYIHGLVGNTNCKGGCVLNWAPPIATPPSALAFWKHMYIYRSHGTDLSTDVERQAAHYAIAKAYGGTLGATSPPQIELGADQDPQGISVQGSWKATKDGPGQAVQAGQSLTGSVSATSSGGALTFDWYLVGGSATDITARNNNPQNYSSSYLHLGQGATSGATNTITFPVPAGALAGNVYQLRVIVHDGQGNAATGSVALHL